MQHNEITENNDKLKLSVIVILTQILQHLSNDEHLAVSHNECSTEVNLQNSSRLTY